MLISTLAIYKISYAYNNIPQIGDQMQAQYRRIRDSRPLLSIAFFRYANLLATSPNGYELTLTAPRLQLQYLLCNLNSYLNKKTSFGNTVNLRAAAFFSRKT